MSDKLDWLNKHLVLLRHLTVQDAIAKESYPLRADLESFVTTDPMPSGAFIYALQEAGKYKEACDFLAYAMHRRAAVWWGYKCLISLNEELDVKPYLPRDIADIGAPNEMPIPEWAKMPDMAAMEAKDKEEAEKAIKQLENMQDKLQAAYDEAMKYVPQEIKDIGTMLKEVIDEEFNRLYHMSFQEFLNKLAQRAADPPFVIDPNSPIFKATAELREQIEAQRKETIELIKSVLPPPMPEKEKKQRDEAMQAVYRWIVAPDEINTQKAMDIGNASITQVAGVLAMVAFWSYGDMMPTGKQVVPTPPGLAANGLTTVFLKAALHQGGTRKFKERCQLYLDMGLDVAMGKDTWSESVADAVPPHQQAASQANEPQPQATAPVRPQTASQPAAPATTYKKWNPNAKESDK